MNKHYVKYMSVALLASIVCLFTLKEIGVNDWVAAVVQLSIFFYLLRHAIKASFHDLYIDEYGDKFVSYDPDTNTVTIYE